MLAEFRYMMIMPRSRSPHSPVLIKAAAPISPNYDLVVYSEVSGLLRSALMQGRGSGRALFGCGDIDIRRKSRAKTRHER